MIPCLNSGVMNYSKEKIVKDVDKCCVAILMWMHFDTSINLHQIEYTDRLDVFLLIE